MKRKINIQNLINNGRNLFLILLTALFILIPNAMQAQFHQQAKLIGTGGSDTTNQGQSVSISADGNTAIIGGDMDNEGVGAAWIFTRSNGIWTQQGNKLVGTGAIGASYQGYSVSISADGNTAIVGGYEDSLGVGAAWIFTRSGGVWTQQGNKLIGTGAVTGNLDLSKQGYSVSISGDGNTAIVGGPRDSVTIGAVWVYTLSGGIWTQQETKIVGTGVVSQSSEQGFSVTLSYDGNTAIVGGYEDSSEIGAAWIFTRTGGVWSQQGNKLVGTGGIAEGCDQGESVSISADGNTAIVGGIENYTNSASGAAWIFTRNAGVWTQQGNKLVGSGSIGSYPYEGSSVSLSYSGDTAVIGGKNDNNDNIINESFGAAWIFTRSGGVWSQLGNKLVDTNAYQANQGSSVCISSDGKTVIVGGPGDNSDIGAAWIYSTQSTGIEEINNRQKTVEIYPNPANTTLNIYLPNSQLSILNSQLYISDVLGNEVYCKQFFNINNSIDISSLNNGVYFYQLKNNKETIRGKFVVEK